MEKVNTDGLQASFENMLMWLRNAAVVVGNDPLINEFKDSCIERAYVIASQDVTPAILGQHPKQEVRNLIDVSAMKQKQIIMRSQLS
jgi:hypothetical protein